MSPRRDTIPRIDLQLSGVFQSKPGGADLYNVPNSSAILTYNNVFVSGGPSLLPNTELTGRLVRISVEVAFRPASSSAIDARSEGCGGRAAVVRAARAGRRALFPVARVITLSRPVRRHLAP